jgi:hypothetical protein
VVGKCDDFIDLLYYSVAFCVKKIKVSLYCNWNRLFQRFADFLNFVQKINALKIKLLIMPTTESLTVPVSKVSDPDSIRSLDPDLSAGCSLLRAEGFFCNLDVLYGGLGTGNCSF